MKGGKMLLKGNLTGFQHLGIPVVDINKAKEWYIQKFGFQVIHEPVIETDAGQIKLSFIKKEDIVLEFYQLLGDDLEEVKKRRHGHIDHFALDVLDVNAAAEEMRQAGASFDPGTPDGPVAIPQFWPKGVEYIFLDAANGEKVELNQRLDLAANRRAHNINGWSHLGIPVTDISQTEAFYQRFGFQKVMDAVIPIGDEQIKAAMMSFNGFTLEFYQLLPADLEEIRTRKDGFIDHVALDVLDINKAFEELTAEGFNTLEPAPVQLPFWENGVKYFNVRGPDGEKIEFNQIL
jgi:lactoylglutathione lyase